jgi:hypothetical protein
MLLRLLHLRRCCTPLLTLLWLLLGCRLLVLGDRRSLLRLTLTLCLRGLWRLRWLPRLTRGLLRLLMRSFWCLTRGLWLLLMRSLWRLTRGLWLLRSLLARSLRLWSQRSRGTLLRRRRTGARTLLWLLTFNPRGRALLLPLLWLPLTLLRLLLHCWWLLTLLLTLTAPPIPLRLLTRTAGRLRRALPQLLVVLPRYRVLRPIAVVLRADDSLLLDTRISIS